MKVAPDANRPALASVYEVAGRFLLVEVRDEQSLRAIQRFLSRWQISLVPDSEVVSIDAKIVFRQGTSPDVPEGFESFELNSSAQGYACDTAYQINFSNAAMFADESDVVSVWFHQPLTTDDKNLPQIVSHSFSAALRRCGVFELHAGGVIDSSDDKAILICGPSASGKSTLTLQLASNGWKYLSDDVVLLGMTRDKVKAMGLRKFFALTQQTVADSGVPQVNALMDQPAMDHGKLLVVPQDLFPSGLVDECWPKVLFFTSIVDEPNSRVKRLSPAATMSRLIRLCPWSCYDRAVARNFLDTLAALVRQSSNFDLFAGNDLMGDPQHTADFLRSVSKGKANDYNVD